MRISLENVSFSPERLKSHTSTEPQTSHLQPKFRASICPGRRAAADLIWGRWTCGR